jgi:hypothetical protein
MAPEAGLVQHHLLFHSHIARFSEENKRNLLNLATTSSNSATAAPSHLPSHFRRMVPTVEGYITKLWRGSESNTTICISEPGSHERKCLTDTRILEYPNYSPGNVPKQPQSRESVHHASTIIPQCSSIHLLELLLGVGSITFVANEKPETVQAFRGIPRVSVFSAPQLAIRRGQVSERAQSGHAGLCLRAIVRKVATR